VFIQKNIRVHEAATFEFPSWTTTIFQTSTTPY
jgi:hypothetical protein